jgi:TetR/AcrR family transcriptional regulator, transcriptional repressor for nem operon
MPRPPTYLRQDVVKAAMEAFWDDGYHGTGMSELEERTGLNRSSLYLAFGNKRALFASALESYIEDVLDPLLAPMELDPPGPGAIATFFSGVKEIVAGSHGRRGCLMVNTAAELAMADDDAAARCAAFRDRLRRAFARALEGSAAFGAMDDRTISRRANTLTACTFGIWVIARMDPVAAASMCDEMTVEIDSWRSPPSASDASERRER